MILLSRFFTSHDFLNIPFFFYLNKLQNKKSDIFLEIKNKTRTFAPAFNKQPITRCP